jgi:hypothetical protein
MYNSPARNCILWKLYCSTEHFCYSHSNS